MIVLFSNPFFELRWREIILSGIPCIVGQKLGDEVPGCKGFHKSEENEFKNEDTDTDAAMIDMVNLKEMVQKKWMHLETI